MTTLRVPSLYNVIEQPASLGGFRLELKRPPVATNDSIPGRGLGTISAQRASLDSLLSAVSSGKILALADVWNGISRIADYYVAEAGKLNTPITPPNILRAEPTPAQLDLGRIFDGLGALKGFADAVEAAQVSEAEAETARMRAAAGTGRGGQVMNMPVGDFSKPISVADVQRANDTFWKDQAAGTPFSEYKRR